LSTSFEIKLFWVNKSIYTAVKVIIECSFDGRTCKYNRWQLGKLRWTVGWRALTCPCACDWLATGSLETEATICRPPPSLFPRSAVSLLPSVKKFRFAALSSRIGNSTYRKTDSSLSATSDRSSLFMKILKICLILSYLFFFPVLFEEL
jgi:hypothetical protein